MPHPSPTSLIFYPSYCYPLSPTYNAWVRLTAADVHALRERAGYEGQNLYFYLNHPIKWIRLVGVVVALDVYPARWIMLLDDSSGATIEVTCARPAPVNSKNGITEPNVPISADGRAAVDGFASKTIGLTATGRTMDLSGIDTGAVVKVKGGLGMFRGQKQVMLERICLLTSTNDELTAWAETNSFRNSILKTPWVLSPDDEQRARNKAEGAEAEEEERRKKKKQKKKLEAEMREKNKQKQRQRQKQKQKQQLEESWEANSNQDPPKDAQRNRVSHSKPKRDEPQVAPEMRKINKLGMNRSTTRPSDPQSSARGIVRTMNGGNEGRERKGWEGERESDVRVPVRRPRVFEEGRFDALGL